MLLCEVVIVFGDFLVKAIRDKLKDIFLDASHNSQH